MTAVRPHITRVNWYWVFQLTGWSQVPAFMLTNGVFYKFSQAMFMVSLWGGVWGLLLSDLWHRMLKRRNRRSMGGKPGWRHMLPAVLMLGMLHTALQTLGFVIFRPYGDITGVGWLPSALMFWWG